MPAELDAAVVARIDATLDQVEAGEHVHILHAIESGSRAWGFPSPDSDYDCRFLYVRAPEAYLSLWPPRDVIETPLVDLLDVNGWDLGKAIKLLLNGNAVAIEWLTSPIIYRSDAAVRDRLLAFARDHVSPARVARHYLHLGQSQRRSHLPDGERVALKKVFYALRPAAALRWLRLHPGNAVAPMHFPTLLATCDIPAEVLELTQALLARKAVTREMGTAPLPPPLTAFIDAEFGAAAEIWDVVPSTPTSEESITAANRLFLDILMSVHHTATPGLPSARVRPA